MQCEHGMLQANETKGRRGFEAAPLLEGYESLTLVQLERVQFASP
jgi:hypothetical protein